MLRKISKFSMFFMVLYLSGCAATGPEFSNIIEPPAEKSQIYIYRPWAFTAGGVGLPIMHNGEQLPYLLHNKGYLNYLAQPGRHEIHVNASGMIDRKFQFDSSPGETYFLKLSVENYVAVMGTRLKLVEKEAAVKEMEGFKLSTTGNSINPAIQESAPVMGDTAKAMSLPVENEVKNKHLVADEIRKLDELRSDGIITQEDFDARKLNLLGL